MARKWQGTSTVIMAKQLDGVLASSKVLLHKFKYAISEYCDIMNM